MEIIRKNKRLIDNLVVGKVYEIETKNKERKVIMYMEDDGMELHFYGADTQVLFVDLETGKGNVINKEDVVSIRELEVKLVVEN